MFADDSSLTVSGDDVVAIGDKLTMEGEKVHQWMLANKLKLNADLGDTTETENFASPP